MNCKNCGNPIASDDSFCTKCGESVPPTISLEKSDELNSISSFNKDANAAGGIKSVACSILQNPKKLLLCIIALVLAVSLIGVAITFGKDSTPSSGTSSKDSTPSSGTSSKDNTPSKEQSDEYEPEVMLTKTEAYYLFTDYLYASEVVGIADEPEWFEPDENTFSYSHISNSFYAVEITIFVRTYDFVYTYYDAKAVLEYRPSKNKHDFVFLALNKDIWVDTRDGVIELPEAWGF